MRDAQAAAGFFGERRDHRRRDGRKKRGALAAAEDDKVNGVARIKLGIGRRCDPAHSVAHWISGDHLFQIEAIGKSGVTKAHRQDIGKAGQRPVGPAHHRILLVQHGRHVGALRGGQRGDRWIAAKSDHHGRVEGAQ